MHQPSLCSLCAPGNPPAPKPELGTDDSPSLGHWASNPDPDADELHTHSQTQPYLRKEPKANVTPEGIDGFFRYVFSRDITADEANLDLSDLKYNPSKPREAGMFLQNKLNGCINSLSLSKFTAYLFAHSYTPMLVKTSFTPGHYTRCHLGSIVTVVWI